MKELGLLSFDEEMLCHGIPVAWYWQLLQVMVDVPLVSYCVHVRTTEMYLSVPRHSSYSRIHGLNMDH